MQLTEEWQYIIILLAFFTFVNISLNIVMLKKFVKAKEQLDAPSFNIETFPSLQAMELHTKKHIYTDINIPSALIFLATNCPKCKSKITMLEKLAVHAQLNGVSLHILLHEQMENIGSFFAQSTLTRLIWQLNYSDYKSVNPHEISPAYLFINENSEVEGQGMIDDENWRYFKQQILGEKN